MKKFMMFVLPVWLVVIGFTSCDNDDNLEVNTQYVNALKEKYPNAVDIDWERKGQYFVADCWVDSKDLDVWFGAGAVWKMTETEMRVNELPEVIAQEIAKSEYKTWKIDDVDLLEYPSKPREYVVEVELGKQEMDLYYSESGELLRKKDVSGADDTHWPE